jgi:hypothetical protein
VLKGLKCVAPGCNFISKSTNISYLTTSHCSPTHPGISSTSLFVPCYFQEIYRSTSVYWLVDHLADTFAGCPPDARKIIEELMTADAVGLNDGRIHAPADVRLVRPFLRTFRWLEWVEDRDPEALEALVYVPIPKKDTEFQWLRGQLQCYMDDALKSLKGFNFVALQIINTPKGYVIYY